MIRCAGILGALLDVMCARGITQALDAITLPGTASVVMHERVGFTRPGVWHQCDYKLGQWWNVGVWQKELQRPRNPPAAVTPFASSAIQSSLPAIFAQGATPD